MRWGIRVRKRGVKSTVGRGVSLVEFMKRCREETAWTTLLVRGKRHTPHHFPPCHRFCNCITNFKVRQSSSLHYSVLLSNQTRSASSFLPHHSPHLLLLTSSITQSLFIIFTSLILSPQSIIFSAESSQSPHIKLQSLLAHQRFYYTNIINKPVTFTISLLDMTHC